MVFMAAALVATHTLELASAGLSGAVRIVTGAVAGFGIGMVAAIMGVPGGELLGAGLPAPGIGDSLRAPEFCETC